MVGLTDALKTAEQRGLVSLFKDSTYMSNVGYDAWLAREKEISGSKAALTGNETDEEVAQQAIDFVNQECA